LAAAVPYDEAAVAVILESKSQNLHAALIAGALKIPISASNSCLNFSQSFEVYGVCNAFIRRGHSDVSSGVVGAAESLSKLRPNNAAYSKFSPHRRDLGEAKLRLC
jgi:hypothetical protein